MTLTAEVPSVRFVGDGATTSFNSGFPALEANDLVVNLEAADGGLTLQTYGVDYTVTLSTTATVVMTTAPAADEALTIERATDRTQETDISASRAFDASVLEAGLDKLTMMVQELDALLDRVYIFPLGDTVTPNTLNYVTITTAQEITGAKTFTQDVALTSTDAGSGLGPNLILTRSSASPADGDNIGSVQFRVRDDAGTLVTAAMLYAWMSDVSTGTVDAGMSLQTIRAGTLTEAVQITSTGNVGIGTTSPSLFNVLYNNLVVGTQKPVSGGMSVIGTSVASILFGDNYSGLETNKAIIQMDMTLNRLSLSADAAIPHLNLFAAPSAYAGRIGINTSTPAYDVDVNGALNADALYIGGVAVTAGGGGGTWGSITGTLSSQTDLQTALDAKVAKAGTQTITGDKTFDALATQTFNGPVYFNDYAYFQGVFQFLDSAWIIQNDADPTRTGAIKLSNSTAVGFSSWFLPPTEGNILVDAAAQTITGVMTFTTPPIITSTDAGSGQGPVLDLYRNSASPAVADNIGGVLFTGKNASAAKKTYGGVYGWIKDTTAGAEKGGVIIQTLNAGTVRDAIIVSQDGTVAIGTSPAELFNVLYDDLVVGSDVHASGGMTVAGSSLASILFSNAIAGAETVKGLIQMDMSLKRLSLAATAATPLLNLFADDATYPARVGIGTSTPDYKLDVNGAINNNTGYYLSGQPFYPGGRLTQGKLQARAQGLGVY